MTVKSTRKRDGIVRFESLDAMPPPAPLSDALKAMDDADVERRAASDPDAGPVPDGFWDGVVPSAPQPKEQITLRLAAEVLRHFRGSGKGYQSRIHAVLKSYVAAQKGR